MPTSGRARSSDRRCWVKTSRHCWARRGCPRWPLPPAAGDRFLVR
jgi:hypothetical protein